MKRLNKFSFLAAVTFSLMTSAAVMAQDAPDESATVEAENRGSEEATPSQDGTSAGGVESSEDSATVVVEKMAPEPTLRELRSMVSDIAAAEEERRAAFAELEARAAEGDIVAAFTVGEFYRSGLGTAANPERAFEYYARAYEGGEPRAPGRMGDLIFAGAVTSQPMERALELYEAAAVESPSINAKIGDLYRLGKGVEADPVRAAEYYQRAVDAEGDNPGAAMRLADIYAGDSAAGNRIPEAIALYEHSAAGGNTTSLIRLGDIYRDGLGVPADYDAAEAAYTQAMEAENTTGKLRLAGLYLTNEADRAEGIAMLEEAFRAGDVGAATQLAGVYLTGQGVPQSFPNAIATLETGLENGDVGAARRLLRLYVDGRGRELPNNIPRARTLLAEITPLLSEETARQETLILEAVAATSSLAWEALLPLYESAPAADRAAAVARAGTINRNTYVFLLQNYLTEAGLYSGALNGLLTQSTISAFNALCREQSASAECASGPLSASARNVFREVVLADAS